MMRSWKSEYARYMREQNLAGSNKASSYIRALDLLEELLSQRPALFPSFQSVWSAPVEQLRDFYPFILEQQKLGDSGIFSGHESPSYWKYNFYSAAIRSLIEFAIVHGHEQRLWTIYENAQVDAATLARQLDEQPLDEAAELVEDKTVNFATKEGKEVLRTIKARVNQAFFRKMVLHNYHHRCCITGIPVPEVLRASHIIPWSEDEANRMNPANGLCLSATYDAAFDAHLISFDESMRLVLSPNLREYLNDESFTKHFKALEGMQARASRRYQPHSELMASHRDKLVA